MKFPNEIAPDALQRLAAEKLGDVLLALSRNPTPLSNQIERLIHAHWDELSASPEQLTLQLRARLPRNEHTRDWIAEAEAVERAAGLMLHSRTLAGIERPERWTRKPHSALVHAMVLLADGDTVISAGEDGQLLRWSLASPDVQPKSIDAHSGPINHLALSPDKRWLASAGDDYDVCLWKLNGSKLGKFQRLSGHRHYVRQVAFGPETLVSVSQDGTARVWSLPQGECVRVIEHGQDAMSLAVSPDGSRLATTTVNSSLLLWDLNSGEQVARLYGNERKVLNVLPGIYLGGTNNSEVGHKDYARALGFSDDGRTLWSVGSEWIVWDLERNAEQIHQPPLMQFSAGDACWLDAERVAIVGDRGVVLARVRRQGTWLEAGAQEKFGVLGVGKSKPTALLPIAGSNLLLSGHDDGSVIAWDLGVDLSTQPEAAHGGVVSELKSSPSKHFVVSRALDHSVCVWDARSGRCLDHLALDNPSSFGDWCAFSGDEQLLAIADGKGTLQVRNLSEGGSVATLRLPSENNYQAVGAVAFAAEPRVVFAGLWSDGVWRVPIDSPEQSRRTEGFSSNPSRLIASKDGRTLIGDDNFAPSEDRDDWQNTVSQLLGWELGTLKRIYKVSGAKSEPARFISFGEVSLQPEGLLTLTGTGEPGLVSRDPHTGEIIKTFSIPLTYASRLERLDDGSLFMLAQFENKGPNRPMFFDLNADRVLHQWDEPEGWHTRAISRDGRLAARTSKTKLELYEPMTGRVRARFFADADLYDVAISFDGTRLLFGDRSGMVHQLELTGAR
jgi:WD40 repeat protein